MALKKARLLSAGGAKIDLIAPAIKPELADLVLQSGGQIWQKPFADTRTQVKNYRLIVLATNDEALHRQLAAQAEGLNLLVNVVDNPELSNLIFPSIIDRGVFTLALSSAGKAPVLLRQWREKIEALLPTRLGDLVEFAGRHRDQIKQYFAEPIARRRFWEVFFASPSAGAVLAGDSFKAEELFEQSLKASKPIKGEVYLVGAGPGDPGLLTLNALQLMQKADIVLYDNLVSKEVLNLCRRDADMLYVGKKREYKIFRQNEINRLMVSYALEGKRVLRLKGGDPFVFGRGGEEMEGLVEHQIAFQVVPGISAANGCAAYAGIPLTHRDYAQSVRFVTGHLKKDDVCLDWPELAKPDQTLVFYMGRKNLPYLVSVLLKSGMAQDTPLAIVENGTLANQKVFVTSLGQTQALLGEIALTGPTVVIIGQVVRLRSRLGYDRPPPADK